MASHYIKECTGTDFCGILNKQLEKVVIDSSHYTFPLKYGVSPCKNVLTP